ncbi:MAG: pilus assembly PilX N-terminal domain-containing protein [Thermodesulfobacteriota bacterium]
MSSRNGFALVAAMMVLALLSVLGIAAVQSTTLEVQISARDRDARAALYLAEAGLEEARYYLARGWGKIEAAAAGQVRVATPIAGPLDSWDGNRYAGFTLVDRTGHGFPIQSHTAAPHPVIAVAGGDPAPGRFFVLREIPDPAADPAVTWDAAASALRVDDPVWAAGTAADRWNPWVLWNASRQGFHVRASGASVIPPSVWLELSGDPGPGPYRLARNPWAAALAAGHGAPGDAHGATPAWDRNFADVAGNPLGTARVQASAHPSEAGRYLLSSTGTVDRSRRQVSLTLLRAGLPEQRLGDWRVEDGL